MLKKYNFESYDYKWAGKVYRITIRDIGGTNRATREDMEGYIRDMPDGPKTSIRIGHITMEEIMWTSLSAWRTVLNLIHDVWHDDTPLGDMDNTLWEICDPVMEEIETEANVAAKLLTRMKKREVYRRETEGDGLFTEVCVESPSFEETGNHIVADQCRVSRASEICSTCPLLNARYQRR